MQDFLKIVAGAFYYVEKPIEFDELLVLIGKAIESKRQKAEIRDLRSQHPRGQQEGDRDKPASGPASL